MIIFIWDESLSRNIVLDEDEKPNFDNRTEKKAKGPVTFPTITGNVTGPLPFKNKEEEKETVDYIYVNSKEENQTQIKKKWISMGTYHI